MTSTPKILQKRVAVTLPAGPKLSDTAARLKWAEDNGYSDAWFSDSGAPDSLTQVAALGHLSSFIRIGVAVTPVYTRSPSVLAATANVIEQVIPGRFVLGIGSSSHTIMGQWNGIPLGGIYAVGFFRAATAPMIAARGEFSTPTGAE